MVACNARPDSVNWSNFTPGDTSTARPPHRPGRHGWPRRRPGCQQATAGIVGIAAHVIGFAVEALAQGRDGQAFDQVAGTTKIEVLRQHVHIDTGRQQVRCVHANLFAEVQSIACSSIQSVSTKVTSNGVQTKNRRL
jgi:hypothetical protein